MNTFETMKTRQSTRSYADKQVEREKIHALIEAANAAPIFGNIHITVIENKEIIQSIGETTKLMMKASGDDFLVKRASDPAYNPTYNAPAFLVLSAKGGNDSMGFNMANVSCAAQNILLAATDSQLASCFVMAPIMAFSERSISVKAGIPKEYVPLVGVLVGYTGQELQPKDRFEKGNVNYC